MASSPPSWFLKWYSTEDRCRASIRELRWPEGFRCPGCGGGRAHINARGLFRCQDCQKQTSELSGTALAGVRISLITWFSVLWVMSKSPSGISASALAKLPDPDDDERNLVTYKTAWLLLHKVRSLMQHQGGPLQGRVEISVEDLQVVELSRFGREGKKTARVFIAVEERSDRSTGGIRLQHVLDHEPETLRKCLHNALGEGANAVVWSHPKIGCEWLGEAGYQNRIGTRAGLLNVNRIMNELRAWQERTHRGELSEKHLGAYLDEFVFRFNHRCRDATPKDIFDDLVRRALHGRPQTFPNVVRGGLEQ